MAVWPTSEFSSFVQHMVIENWSLRSDSNQRSAHTREIDCFPLDPALSRSVPMPCWSERLCVEAWRGWD